MIKMKMWIFHFGLLAIVLPLILAAKNYELPNTLWMIKSFSTTLNLSQSKDNEYRYNDKTIVRSSRKFLFVAESQDPIDGNLEYTQLNTSNRSWLGLNLDIKEGLFFTKNNICNYEALYFEFSKELMNWRAKPVAVYSRRKIMSHKDILLIIPKEQMKEEYINKDFYNYEINELFEELEKDVEKLAIIISFKKLCLIDSMQVDEKNKGTSSYFKRATIWGPYTIEDKDLYDTKDEYAAEHILEPNLVVTRSYHQSDHKIGYKGGLPCEQEGITYTPTTHTRITFIKTLSMKGQEYVLPRMTTQQVALIVDSLEIRSVYDDLGFKDFLIKGVPVRDGQYILIVPTSCSGTLLNDKKKELLKAVNKDNFEMVQNFVVKTAFDLEVTDPITIARLAVPGNIKKN